jgi:hypothetical protein
MHKQGKLYSAHSGNILYFLLRAPTNILVIGIIAHRDVLECYKRFSDCFFFYLLVVEAKVSLEKSSCSGTGASMDVVVSSVKAYISALNKMLGFQDAREMSKTFGLSKSKVSVV